MSTTAVHPHTPRPGSDSGPSDRFRSMLLAERETQEAVARDYDAAVAELTGQGDVDSLLEREMAAAGAERARAALRDIDAALERIEAGTYGRCVVCGETIPEARLEAIPHTRTCVNCPDPT